MNIPNYLTWARVVMIPLLVIFFYIPGFIASQVVAWLFVVACLTDWLDGYLARKWQQTSPFGAFLDPVADKIMVVVVLVLLVGQQATVWLAVPAAIIIAREVIVSAMREWMAELGKRAVIKVSWIGKLKTTLQMVAIIVLLFFKDYYVLTSPLWVGYVLLYAAALLTLWSMMKYILATRCHI